MQAVWPMAIGDCPELGSIQPVPPRFTANKRQSPLSRIVRHRRGSSLISLDPDVPMCGAPPLPNGEFRVASTRPRTSDRRQGCYGVNERQYGPPTRWTMNANKRQSPLTHIVRHRRRSSLIALDPRVSMSDAPPLPNGD
jgi:hypothetical protein